MLTVVEPHHVCPHYLMGFTGVYDEHIYCDTFSVNDDTVCVCVLHVMNGAGVLFEYKYLYSFHELISQILFCSL